MVCGAPSSGSLTCPLGAAHLLCVSFGKFFVSDTVLFMFKRPVWFFCHGHCHCLSYLLVGNKSLRATSSCHVTVTRAPGALWLGFRLGGCPCSAPSCSPGRPIHDLPLQSHRRSLESRRLSDTRARLPGSPALSTDACRGAALPPTSLLARGASPAPDTFQVSVACAICSCRRASSTRASPHMSARSPPSRPGLGTRKLLVWREAGAGKRPVSFWVHFCLPPNPSLRVNPHEVPWSSEWALQGPQEHRLLKARPRAAPVARSGARLLPFRLEGGETACQERGAPQTSGAAPRAAALPSSKG